jgi:hypothetical protein
MKRLRAGISSKKCPAIFDRVAFVFRLIAPPKGELVR